MLRSPRVNDPFVLVAGDSQLQTFVSGRVSCPNEWAVLSVPGGRFSHVGDAIHQVVCRDFLGRENPTAIVLMCGTNDLVSPSLGRRIFGDCSIAVNNCFHRFRLMPLHRFHGVMT